MNKVSWKIDGMTCSNCALSVHKYLEKEGMKDITVNPITGNTVFSNEQTINKERLIKGINNLGYQVLFDDINPSKKKKWIQSNKIGFFITLPFTLLLMMHMFHQWIPFHAISNPWVQLYLCIPVFLLGLYFFGKSALQSIISGVPNMNVLVSIGSIVSFLYSLIGLLYYRNPNEIYFETSASIITLVLLGNYIEEITMRSTQKALGSLLQSQKVMANMIAFDDKHQEQIFPIEGSQLKTGDLLLINTGEKVPSDCKILWGEATVNESILTGESLPIFKTKKDILIGGSIIENGTVKAQVTATGNDTVLSGILKMVQKAQSEKPPMQKMADKISAVFVPTVIVISIVAFFINHYLFNITIDQSLMRAIAVLVISCPCAMGLATPAAISVGLGRAAKAGIFFRNATILESFKHIKQIVFDKTGTLTTGRFDIQNYHSAIDDTIFKSIVCSMEKHSSHPIAKSILQKWNASTFIPWKKIEEIKGMGVRSEDHEGNIFELGSHQMTTSTVNDAHQIYLLKNKQVIGWIDIKDELRPEAKEVLDWFHKKNIRTILLTGDTNEKAAIVAAELGIKTYFAEQSPEEKMKRMTLLNNEAPTAMVGDGINDAAALSKASIGISLSDASQLALQSADVILMNQDLGNLPMALGIGKHTFMTIKQNLFWAFSYNIIAIPIATMGLLTPTFSAMAMGFSDIVLAAISLQLFIKKLN